MTDTYLTISEIAATPRFQARVAACAAQQGAADPPMWAHENRWKVAAATGWAAAVDYWRAVNPEAPADGWATDPACITDGMILAKVQPMLLPPAPEPEPVE